MNDVKVLYQQTIKSGLIVLLEQTDMTTVKVLVSRQNKSLFALVIFRIFDSVFSEGTDMSV